MDDWTIATKLRQGTYVQGIFYHELSLEETEQQIARIRAEARTGAVAEIATLRAEIAMLRGEKESLEAIIINKDKDIIRLEALIKTDDDIDKLCDDVAENKKVRSGERKAYNKLKAALIPFAIIGRTIPVSWRGDVPYKNQTSSVHSAGPALVDDYRKAAEALCGK